MTTDFDRDDSRMKRMNGLLALQVLPVEGPQDTVRNTLLQAPCYRVVTKLVASVTMSHTDMLHNGCFTSEPIPGSKERARIYEVTRNLNHFLFFQQLFYEKNPFTITAQLPDRSSAHTVEGIDQVLALLFIIAASDVTNNDPTFWSFLTLPDADYDEQYMALSSKTKTERVGGLLQLAKSKLTARLPQLELKPSEISNMMIETGMVDRAFITMDKISQCAERSMYFSRVLEGDDHLELWEAALKRMYDVRDAVELESDALTAVGDTLVTKVADAQYWPWTKFKLLAQSSSSSGLAQRLSQILHRTGNVAHQLSRNSNNVISSDFGLSTSLQCTTVLSRRYSAKLAHEYLHVTHQPKPNGRTLIQLQDQLMEIIAKGRGFEEADALDAIDDEISEIHDLLDRGIDGFERQFHDMRIAMTERLVRNLREMHVEQMLAWTSAQMLLSNLASAMESDPFDDVEDLPIMELPDHESPARRAAMEQELQNAALVEDATYRITSKGTGLFYRPAKQQPTRPTETEPNQANPTSPKPAGSSSGKVKHVDTSEPQAEELSSVFGWKLQRPREESADSAKEPMVTSSSDPRLAELQTLVQKQSKAQLLDTHQEDDEFGAEEFSGRRRAAGRQGPSSVGSSNGSPLHAMDAPRRKWMNEEDSADPFQW